MELYFFAEARARAVHLLHCCHPPASSPLARDIDPAHKNNQTQEQLLSLCHPSPELLISGLIPTLAIHLHITYFIIPICILHTTFALLLYSNPSVLVLI